MFMYRVILMHHSIRVATGDSTKKAVREAATICLRPCDLDL